MSRDPVRPWLDDPKWASRVLVVDSASAGQQVRRGCVTGVVVGGAALMAAVGLALMASGSLAGLLMLALAGAVAHVWAHHRAQLHGSADVRPFRFVCTLETLPGVIGGWFKARVEATLPRPPDVLSIELQHSKTGPARRAPILVWALEREFAASTSRPASTIGPVAAGTS